jgi:ubiquitin-conjugating enzyme E2 G1
MNPDEKAEERWRPILGVEAIIISVISMLSDPNLSSPANIDAAKQYKENRAEYIKKVKHLAAKALDSL